MFSVPLCENKSTSDPSKPESPSGELDEGQFEYKARPAIRGRLEAGLAAVGLGDRADDGQAEAVLCSSAAGVEGRLRRESVGAFEAGVVQLERVAGLRATRTAFDTADQRSRSEEHPCERASHAGSIAPSVEQRSRWRERRSVIRRAENFPFACDGS